MCCPIVCGTWSSLASSDLHLRCPRSLRACTLHLPSMDTSHNMSHWLPSRLLHGLPVPSLLLHIRCTPSPRRPRHPSSQCPLAPILMLAGAKKAKASGPHVSRTTSTCCPARGARHPLRTGTKSRLLTPTPPCLCMRLYTRRRCTQYQVYQRRWRRLRVLYRRQSCTRGPTSRSLRSPLAGMWSHRGRCFPRRRASRTVRARGRCGRC